VLPDPKVATYDSNSGGCPPPSGTTFTCPLGKIVAGGNSAWCGGIVAVSVVLSTVLF
jgi:hypothetical protein